MRRKLDNISVTLWLFDVYESVFRFNYCSYFIMCNQYIIILQVSSQFSQNWVLKKKSLNKCVYICTVNTIGINISKNEILVGSDDLYVFIF